MHVTLAVPYDGHEPDETIECDDATGRQLIRDGWARLPESPALNSSKQAWVEYAEDAGVNVPEGAKRAEIVAAVAEAGAPVPDSAQPTEDSPTTGTTQNRNER